MKQVITFILQKGQQLDNFMSKFFPKYWEEIGTSAGGLANYVNNQANAETYTNNKNGYTLTLSSVQGINSATDFYALHESIRSKANPLNNLSTSRAKKLSQASVGWATRCPRGSHSWDFAQLFLFSADIHNISIPQFAPDISGSLKAAN